MTPSRRLDDVMMTPAARLWIAGARRHAPAMLHDTTVILAWSVAEAARYLETLRAYARGPPHSYEEAADALPPVACLVPCLHLLPSHPDLRYAKKPADLIRAQRRRLRLRSSPNRSRLAEHPDV